jgi:hypothetical protein
VLQASELALDGGAAAVEGAPFVGTARDAKVALFLALAERDHSGAVALGALGIDAVMVIALRVPETRFAVSDGAWAGSSGAYLLCLLGV